jgi:hypothetical protein
MKILDILAEAAEPATFLKKESSKKGAVLMLHADAAKLVAKAMKLDKNGEIRALEAGFISFDGYTVTIAEKEQDLKGQ